MAKYFVTLKPIGSYFFGGENTFGEKECQGYSVKSRDLPQVSAIMGIVRYAILAFHDKLDGQANKTEQAEYVGASSFSLETTNASYGHIQSISPVFIRKGDKILTLISCCTEKREDKLPGEITPITECAFVPDTGSKINFVKAKSDEEENKGIVVNVGSKKFNFKNFDIESHWIDGSGNICDKDCPIVVDDERVGILKQVGVPDNDKGYFIKTAKRLADDCCFCFTVDLSKELPANKPSTLFVNLGGERSLFKIEFTPTGDDILDNFKDISMDDNCLLLLSDAYFTDKELQSFDFVWGLCDMNRYTANTHKWSKGSRSSLYRLLSRGSVIYHHDKETLEQLRWGSSEIEKKHLHDAGLNIMINYKKNTNNE